MNKKKMIKIISLVLSLVLIVSTVVSVSANDNVEDYTSLTNYGTVEDGITSARIKGTRAFEKKEIDTTNATNPFSFLEGLKYWGPIDSILPNDQSYINASSVASVKEENSEKYLEVGKTDATKKCGVYTVNVKIPEEANGHTLALFYQAKASGDKTANGIYSYVTLKSGSSTDSEYSAMNLSRNSVKSETWAVVTGDAFTKGVWNKESSGYDCVSVWIENETNSAVTDIKNIVLAYENKNGEYVSFYDSSVSYNGVTNLPYYGTVQDGIACIGKDYARIYQLNAIDTTKNPFSLEEGLKYWGATSITGNSNTMASEMAKVKNDNGEKYLEVGKTDATKKYGVGTVNVKIPEEASGHKLALFYQAKASGDKTTNGIYSYVTLKSGSSTNSKYSATNLSKNSVKSETWAVVTGDAFTSSVWNKDSSEYDCVSVYIENEYNNTVTDIKNIVLAYENADGTYTSFYNSAVIYNSITKLPYYGTEKDGMYTEAAANKRINNMTVATDSFMNGDFSQGLQYWAPRDSQYGFASTYASVSEGVLTLKTDNEYNGVTSCFVKIPDIALGKKVVGIFEYKANESMGNVKLVTSAPDVESESNTDFGINQNKEYQVACTKYKIFKTSGSTVRIEVENDTNPVSMKNFAFVYIDEIGIPGRDLYANLDGTPYGYEMGDANADKDVDVRDLVRMKHYIVEKDYGIYFTAANMSKNSTTEISDNSVAALINKLLGSEK